jgi:hypothetical protein
MTYLELVNKVLIRLRENEVTSVQDTPYSKLIGEFINITKREVEDAWNWEALHTTITATTVSGLYSYVLTGSGTRSRILDVINDTNDYLLKRQTKKWFDKSFLIRPIVTDKPRYYNINGVSNETGDHQVDLYPVPDGVYEVRFNLVQPQPDLVEDSDDILVPYQVVIEGALALALDERGEDGGYQKQDINYRNILADFIAIENGGRVEDTIWYSC